MNWSEEALSNKGKPTEPSPIDITADENSAKPLAVKEERSDCIPRFDKTDEGVVFGGHCTVPIAGLMTIEVRGTLASCRMPSVVHLVRTEIGIGTR